MIASATPRTERTVHTHRISRAIRVEALEHAERAGDRVTDTGETMAVVSIAHEDGYVVETVHSSYVGEPEFEAFDGTLLFEIVPSGGSYIVEAY